MDSDCIFCKIINKDIPADPLYEDDSVIVIKDINPKAPVHLLVITKEHISSIKDLDSSHEALIGYVIMTAKKQAELNNIAESGYKLVFNVGKDGGQVVPHIHLHILGGKQLEE